MKPRGATSSNRLVTSKATHPQPIQAMGSGSKQFEQLKQRVYNSKGALLSTNSNSGKQREATISNGFVTSRAPSSLCSSNGKQQEKEESRKQQEAMRNHGKQCEAMDSQFRVQHPFNSFEQPNVLGINVKPYEARGSNGR